MPTDFDSPDSPLNDASFGESPFIRITRNGAVTELNAGPRGSAATATAAQRRATTRAEYAAGIGDEPAFDESSASSAGGGRRPRGSRPMPKRLSEEAREAAEAESRAARLAGEAEFDSYVEEEEEEVAKPAKRARAKRTSKKKEAEQIALPLKPARAKQDSIVKQRQVLGFSCVVIAILVFLAIVSYTPNDAPYAETKLSDIPAIITGSDPMLNAHADVVHNWLRLLGAMLADFLINKTIGYAAIIYPIFFGWWSLAFFRFTHKQRRRLTLATTFFLITAILFSATIGTASHLFAIPREWSGAVGQFLGLAFSRLLGAVGGFIVYASLFIITLVFSIDLDIEKTFLRVKGYWSSAVLWTRSRWIQYWDAREVKRLEREAELERLQAEEEEEERLEKEAEARDDLEEAPRASGAKKRGKATQVEEEESEELEEEEAPVVRKGAKAAAIAATAATVAATVEDADATPLTIARNGKADELARNENAATQNPSEPALKIRRVSDALQAKKDEAASNTVSTALAASAAATAAANSNAQVVPGQPLLKVRPAPKAADGSPIPRMTKPDQNKLGQRASVNFTRLTNGAVSDDDEPQPLPTRMRPMTTEAAALDARGAAPIIPMAEASDALAESPVAETLPNAQSDDDFDPIHNIDLSEDVIDPLKAKKPGIAPPVERPESKITVRSDRPVQRMTEAPVILGDEKTLSNEALPHSIDTGDLRDVVKDHQAASKVAARTADAMLRGELGGPGEDLFYEEGQKPVIPENPYNELLPKYRNPSIDILTPADPKDNVDADDEELAMKGRLLRDKLATFGVEIENITVTPGPVVTLFEFTPAEGIKVSRVENLTDDIALAMKARGIRIIAPIPGRGTIGVEIPNDEPKMVRIRSLIESDAFRNTKMNLPLALGKTISGDVYIDDLNKMPHLLIAGATGSGKSVGVNGIIASLLYAKSPKDVKFVIVDPKKIELSLYKKLRKHYLIVSPEAGEDIVTTPAFAVLALKAVELEMEKRYDKLAKAAVRSLADYNMKVAQGKLRSTQEEQHYHLPYIVVIIDELADLMITAGREIEEPICRIAQMARAVGIHLILATQRPSVDVITGVIKANFPARVAFQVATRVDSRTILDSMGAEQLLGNGDMLYQPSGTPKPIRLQSPYISTEEVESMIDAIAMQDGDKLSYSRPWTLPSLRQKDGRGGSTMDEEDTRDELFEDAAKIIVRHQQGSVSLLQRRLKVGYSRAARIVDELEQAGIVGPFDGSKARQVLCENDEELELVLEGLR